MTTVKEAKTLQTLIDYYGMELANQSCIHDYPIYLAQDPFYADEEGTYYKVVYTCLSTTCRNNEFYEFFDSPELQVDSVDFVYSLKSVFPTKENILSLEAEVYDRSI